MGNPTEKQIALLQKHGKEIPSTSAEASKIIGELFNSSNNNGSGYKKSFATGVALVIPQTAPNPDAQAWHDQVLTTAYAQAKKVLPNEPESSTKFSVTLGMFHNVIAQYLSK